MAAQGQDPTSVIQLAVSVIKDLQNGVMVEDAVANAFAAQAKAKAEEAAEAAAQAPPGAGGPGDTSGVGPDGRPQGVAPGQAGMPAGGRPTLDQMVSGLRGDGNMPVQSAEIRRSVATGA